MIKINILFLDGDCHLSDVLQFVAGTRTIPPGGLAVNGNVPTLAFKKEGYPTASTCAVRLELPMTLPPKKTFSEVMVEAIKGSAGVLQV